VIWKLDLNLILILVLDSGFGFGFEGLFKITISTFKVRVMCLWFVGELLC